jgi:peptidylprolyl isomerase/FKBP-type peptidyl-prolyl cis-trans isomerase FklB
MRTLLILSVTLALMACTKARQIDPAAAGAAFLAANAHAAGVRTTASGLEYRILRPKPADEVKVDYEGKLTDGEVFDSSYARGAPAVMTVRDLVPGWREALQLMRPGDEWEIWLPAKLGYGDKGAGPIPPGAVLEFRLQLIGVLPDPSSLGRA